MRTVCNVRRLRFLFLCGIIFSALAWSSDAAVQLVGVGGTFPQPVYAKWFERFGNANPNIQIHYLPQGSGEGIQGVTSGRTDYGASDAPLTDQQLKQADVRVLHFPTLVSGVVPIYNLPGIDKTLRFTPEALAGIYLGKITKWNDPALARANPGIHLPPSTIVVIHTADGRGTTYIWSDYLSKVSPQWKTQVGKGTTVKWPVGTAQEGNGNVASAVKASPHSVGFVDLPYALINHVSYGSVRNAAGNFVLADLESVTEAAAACVKESGDDLRLSLTDAPGAGSYPISSFTWILVPERISDAGKRKALIQVMHWVLTEGQDYAKQLNYAPLPWQIVEKELVLLKRLSAP